MLKAVIFDMDGVLVDSETVHLECHKRLMTKLGLDYSFDYYKGFIGRTAEYMWRTMVEDFAPDKTWMDLKNISDKILADLLGDEGYPEIKGAAELVRNLCNKSIGHENIRHEGIRHEGIRNENIRHENIKLALASSGEKDRINAVLERMGIKDCFEVIVSGDDVKNPKPDPEIFIKAVDKLGLKPEECIVIEDSLNGMKAAKAAGTICFGYENKFNSDYSYADCVLTGFDGLDVRFFKQEYAALTDEPWEIFDTERLYVREFSRDDIPELINLYKENSEHIAKELLETVKKCERKSEEKSEKKFEKKFENKSEKKFENKSEKKSEATAQNDEYEEFYRYIKSMYIYYGFGFWGLYADRNEGEDKEPVLIGSVSVYCKDTDIYVGYIIDKRFRGKGYGYEGVLGTCRFLQDYFGFEVLNFEVEKNNIPSIRIFEKLKNELGDTIVLEII